jgi:hypothetical protein
MNKTAERKLYEKLYEARRERDCAKSDLKDMQKAYSAKLSELEITQQNFLRARDLVLNNDANTFILKEIFSAFGLPVEGDSYENRHKIMQKIKRYNTQMEKLKKKKSK